MAITKADLHAHTPLDEPSRRVEALLQAMGSDTTAWVRFLGRYTAWNGCFGSAVASLAGRIGRARDSFLDPREPLPLVSDRSVLVGSFFFDAARDEFNDRQTKHRDTHRCLAQALIKGFLLAVDKPAVDAKQLWSEPAWLKVLQAKVFHGYGDGFPVERPFLFRAMGYHLGSEVLADQEFTIIDQTMRAALPAVVDKMLALKVVVGDEQHGAYEWLRIHSGHGSAAEADHFAWAIKGVDAAFRFAPPAEEQGLRAQVLGGFGDFARDQREFFDLVLTP